MPALLWQRHMGNLTDNMKKFFIITNEHKDKNLAVTNSIADYIHMKGGTCSHYVSTKSSWSERNLRTFRTADIDADCIIVLGGDGTLVRAARDLARMQIPLIGVNLGTLGYLCELERSTVFGAIDRLFEGKYELEQRMLIEGESKAGGGETKATLALNDIVIHRCGVPQIVNLVVSVNGEYLATYSADGIIIATPTGSTGYSMSAGGPIVDPKADLILITPINPHSTVGRSIVVGSDAQIEVTLSRRRQEQDEEAEVSFDGDRFVKMKVGDKILVKKADKYAQILKLNQVSFLQILRKKMQEYR